MNRTLELLDDLLVEVLETEPILAFRPDYDTLAGIARMRGTALIRERKAARLKNMPDLDPADHTFKVYTEDPGLPKMKPIKKERGKGTKPSMAKLHPEGPVSVPCPICKAKKGELCTVTRTRKRQGSDEPGSPIGAWRATKTGAAQFHGPRSAASQRVKAEKKRDEEFRAANKEAAERARDNTPPPPPRPEWMEDSTVIPASEAFRAQVPPVHTS